MNLKQHPISAAFPGLDAERIEAHLDGVLPMDRQQIEAVIASAWFRGLTSSQRAIYVALWSHMRTTGSNQHKKRVDTRTVRYAAEAAKALIERASHA